MNRYNIRIDGEIMPNSYTYEELLINDILEFDDIEVKEISNSKWEKVKTFYFPEEHSESSEGSEAFEVDENGQVHFKKKAKKARKKEERKKEDKIPEYRIDEFGQVVSTNNLGGRSSSTSTSNSTSNNRNTSSHSDSSSTTANKGNGWRLLVTIIVLIIMIIIITQTSWGIVPAIMVGCWAINGIWSDSN